MPSPSLGGCGACRNDGDESAAGAGARCTTGAVGSGTYVAAPSEVLPSVCLGSAGTDGSACDTGVDDGKTGAETGEPVGRSGECGGAASTCSTGKAPVVAAIRELPPKDPPSSESPASETPPPSRPPSEAPPSDPARCTAAGVPAGLPGAGRTRGAGGGNSVISTGGAAYPPEPVTGPPPSTSMTPAGASVLTRWVIGPVKDGSPHEARDPVKWTGSDVS